MSHDTVSANDESHRGTTRRRVLLGLGAAAATCAATARAAMPGHDHSKHSAQHGGLLEAVNTCTDKGQRCIAHCLVSFQEGDLQLADCAAKVHEMQAVCEAYRYLLASNSEYSSAYATICEQVCTDCEEECRKHEEHVECKACAEACADVVDQIKLTFA